MNPPGVDLPSAESPLEHAPPAEETSQKAFDLAMLGEALVEERTRMAVAKINYWLAKKGCVEVKPKEAAADVRFCRRRIEVLRAMAGVALAGEEIPEPR